MSDEPENFVEFAEQYRPHPKSQRSWGNYFAALAGGGIIDGAYALKDALTPKPAATPLYVPDDDAPLYQRGQEVIVALELPEPERFGQLFVRQCEERLKFALYPSTFITFVDMAEDIYLLSRPSLPLMLPAELSKSIEGARWRDEIRALIRFAQSFNFFAVLTTAHEVTCQFLAALPPIARVEWPEFRQRIEHDDEEIGLTIELNDLIPHLAEVVEYMIYPFYKAEHMQSGLYQSIRDVLDRNACAASDLPFTDENRASAKLVMPSAYKGADVVGTYLRDSPLMQVFA